MLASVNDLIKHSLGGTDYWFRAPSVYDPAKMRRVLARQGVRRPAPAELRVAALAGVVALGETVGDLAEGGRQREVLEDWYRLLEPTREDDIDEPDFEKRAAELERLEAARRSELVQLHAQVAAIEANLERHCPPYRELVADRAFWDDVSRIEIVRLLLVKIGAAELQRDEDELVTQAIYRSIPGDHRLPLATFAFRLLAPDETQRKN